MWWKNFAIMRVVRRYMQSYIKLTTHRKQEKQNESRAYYIFESNYLERFPPSGPPVM